MSAPTFDEWLVQGVELGYASPPSCLFHDGYPLTAEEEAETEEGDTCLFLMRPYPDHDTRRAVEENHPPAVWRKRDLGL